MANTPEASSVSFEKALEEIQKIVRKMETGELPLEDSLKEFERGMGLVQSCRKTLDDAEKRVEILVSGVDDPGRAPKTNPFEE